MADNTVPERNGNMRSHAPAAREETAVLATWLQTDDPEALKALRALQGLDGMRALDALANLEGPEVDAGFRARLRNQLMEEADSTRSSGDTNRQAKVWTMLRTGFGVFGRRKR